MSEFLNTKTFLPKYTRQTGLKKLLLSVKSKIKFHGHMLLIISIMKKLFQRFMKKNYKRLIK